MMKNTARARAMTPTTVSPTTRAVLGAPRSAMSLFLSALVLEAHRTRVERRARIDGGGVHALDGRADPSTLAVRAARTGDVDEVGLTRVGAGVVPLRGQPGNHDRRV